MLRPSALECLCELNFNIDFTLLFESLDSSPTLHFINKNAHYQKESNFQKFCVYIVTTCVLLEYITSLSVAGVNFNFSYFEFIYR